MRHHGIMLAEMHDEHQADYNDHIVRWRAEGGDLEAKFASFPPLLGGRRGARCGMSFRVTSSLKPWCSPKAPALTSICTPWRFPLRCNQCCSNPISLLREEQDEWKTAFAKGSTPTRCPCQKCVKRRAGCDCKACWLFNKKGMLASQAYPTHALRFFNRRGHIALDASPPSQFALDRHQSHHPTAGCRAVPVGRRYGSTTNRYAGDR